MTCADTTPGDPPGARGRPAPNRGIPPPHERGQLVRGFGRALRYERARRGWTVDDLAAAAGTTGRNLRRLEGGSRRPSRGMLYRLARALREGADERAVAALAERLCDLAGSSLRDYSRRPHRRRARLAAQVRAEAGEASPASLSDDLPGLVLAELARRVTPPPLPPGRSARRAVP